MSDRVRADGPPAAIKPNRRLTLETTLNSISAYCVTVGPVKLRKKYGRLQHGLLASDVQVADVAPVSAEPRPRLAQAEQPPEAL